MKYLITKKQGIMHGTIGWQHDGNDGQYCEAGEAVVVTFQPQAGWGISELSYTDDEGNVVKIEGNEFVMPDSNVVIDAVFKRFSVEDWEGYEGGGGTSDYNDLNNKPKINDITLEGNNNSEQLGIIVPKRIKDDPTGEGVIEGYVQGNKASGPYSHAEGSRTAASSHSSHAEGNGTTASSHSSHAEGDNTTASGNGSHAEGNNTTASGNGSHAEGDNTIASGHSSHAEGFGTGANRAYQHVFGKYNTVEQGEPISEGNYVEIVGNGTDENQRRNARTLSWDGKEWLADTLEVSREPETENEVATKGYVDGNTMKRVVVDEEKLIGEWVEGGVTYDLYEKVVAFGELPNNGQKQVEHGITNNVRFVDVKGFAYGNNNLSIPLANAQGTLFIYLGVGNTKITIDTNSDRSNLTGYVYLTFIRSKP